MSRKTIYICDQCGAERKEANHWFVVDVLNNELWLTTWNVTSRTTGALHRDNTSSRHLCGQACVHKFVDEFMSGKVDATTPS